MAAVKKKKSTSSRGPRRRKPALKPEPFVIPQAQAESSSGPNLLPAAIIILVIIALWIALRKPPLPQATVANNVPPARRTMPVPPEPSHASKAPDVAAESKAAPTIKPTLPAARRSAGPGSSPSVTWNREDGKSVKFVANRPENGVAEVRIFRFPNQSVRLLKSGPGKRENVELLWDGKDESGKLVEPGTYYARVTEARGDSILELKVK